MPFAKGQSGNPAGRPKGSGDKRTSHRQLIDAHIPELVEVVVELAKQGDVGALKLCFERSIPRLKPQEFTPEESGGSFDDWYPTSREILGMLMYKGQVPPDVVKEMMTILVAYEESVVCSSEWTVDE